MEEAILEQTTNRQTLRRCGDERKLIGGARGHEDERGWGNEIVRAAVMRNALVSLCQLDSTQSCLGRGTLN